MPTVPVTPVPGTNSSILVGGVAVVAIPANPNGGFITNPLSGDDQGLPAPENLYVNPVDGATLQGNGNTFVLGPGQSWTVIAGQTTPTTVNSVTSGHKFSAVYW